MNKDIYDYAYTLDNCEHVSFYEVFKILLKDKDCIVCKKSVADLLGYSNGGFRKNIEIYSTKDYNLPYLKQFIKFQRHILYELDNPKKRAVGLKLSDGMDIPIELADKFKFARQKSKLAGIIRGSYFTLKGENETLMQRWLDNMK